MRRMWGLQLLYVPSPSLLCVNAVLPPLLAAFDVRHLGLSQIWKLIAYAMKLLFSVRK